MKKLIPVFISVVVITMNVLSAEAAENVLREVNVKKTPNAYTVELTSTAPAHMTKNIISSNRIIINLENVEISDNLSTKYDGNAVIDNVMVEPYGKNGANIMIQGNNIAYSDVKFKAPATIEQMEDSVSSTVSSLFSLMKENNQSGKTIPILILLILVGIMVGEIRFIKSKYDELNAEKEFMKKDIENTKDFQNYIPNFGSIGYKKPYTTPVYESNFNKLYGMRTNIIRKLKTSEMTTLNMMLHNDNQEGKILDRIVNNKPTFETMFDREKENNFDAKNLDTITNPLMKSELKSNMKYLQMMSDLYKEKTFNNIGTGNYTHTI